LTHVWCQSTSVLKGDLLFDPETAEIRLLIVSDRVTHPSAAIRPTLQP